MHQLHQRASTGRNFSFFTFTFIHSPLLLCHVGKKKAVIYILLFGPLCSLYQCISIPMKSHMHNKLLSFISLSFQHLYIHQYCRINKSSICLVLKKMLNKNAPLADFSVSTQYSLWLVESLLIQLVTPQSQLNSLQSQDILPKKCNCWLLLATVGNYIQLLGQKFWQLWTTVVFYLSLLASLANCWKLLTSVQNFGNCWQHWGLTEIFW